MKITANPQSVIPPGHPLWTGRPSWQLRTAQGRQLLAPEPNQRMAMESADFRDKAVEALDLSQNDISIMECWQFYG